MKVALWIVGVVALGAVIETWRTKRALASRGGRGYPIITTTGIRG